MQGNKNPYVAHPELVYLAWLYDGTLPNDDTEGPDFTGSPRVSVWRVEASRVCLPSPRTRAAWSL